MSKFQVRLRMFKAKSGLKNNIIAKEIFVTPQTITDWLSDKKTPKRIRKDIADRLVGFTNNYISLKDCGYL